MHPHKKTAPMEGKSIEATEAGRDEVTALIAELCAFTKRFSGRLSVLADRGTPGRGEALHVRTVEIGRPMTAEVLRRAIDYYRQQFPSAEIRVHGCGVYGNTELVERLTGHRLPAHQRTRLEELLSRLNLAIAAEGGA